METPVIYFYTNDIHGDSVMKVNVKVKFPKGSISQFYPTPSKLESLPKEVYNYPNTMNTIDFGIPYNGWIEWETFINAKNYKIRSNRYIKKLIPGNHVWNSPRLTNSNLIYTEEELVL